MAATSDQGFAVPVVPLSYGKPMPRVGLGTASFPHCDDGDQPHVREAVLHAIDAGYRHFDTAAVYGTERAIGDAAAEAVRAGTLASRDELYITSKLWIADAHPGRVLPALRKTLRNLQMEYVDLYLVHFPVSMKPQEGEAGAILVKEDLVAMDMKGVWEEMEECHRQGLAKAIGVSNFACKKLEYLLSFAQIIPAVNQVEVHPYCRQNKLRAFCREKGIQLCAYSPLGGKGAPWANNSVMESPIIKQIAQDIGKTVAQVCIRWVYEQGDCVIPKSFNDKRMRENLDIFDWELTDDARHKISSLPEFRGTYDFFVHDSGPYKTAEEFWDDEIAAGHPAN
ncbi:unnamed protein product [Urochloa decumbens]|uniref:NADP-dependent oxidoreductase domain-containing protein n=1 Tax=Urochloa decumbens TaxID=240449 RepID=A0ABC8YCP4_9POAL